MVFSSANSISSSDFYIRSQALFHVPRRDTHCFGAFFEMLVNVQGQELGRPRVRIDERLKGLQRSDYYLA